MRRQPSLGQRPVRKYCVEDDGGDKEDGKDGNPVVDVKSDKVQDQDFGNISDQTRPVKSPHNLFCKIMRNGRKKAYKKVREVQSKC